MGSDKLIEKTPTEDALSLPADNPSPSPSARMAYGARLRMDILTTNYWLLPTAEAVMPFPFHCVYATRYPSVRRIENKLGINFRSPTFAICGNAAQLCEAN